MYNSNKKEGDSPIPVEWLAAEEKLEDIYDTIYEEFQYAVFKSKSKCTREEFIEDLKETNKQWL